MDRSGVDPGLQRRDGAPAVAGREIDLRSGDVLYLPRGFPHKAVATDEPSLHLTLGIHPFYWVDALKAAVDLVAREDRELRTVLPPQVSSPEALGEELARRFGELLARVGEKTDLGDVFRALTRARQEQCFEPPDGHLEELTALDRLKVETTLERRDGIACTVCLDDGKARIDFGSNHVSGPTGLAPALEFVGEHRRFRIAELPGGLSDSSKLVLARRLVREGLLRRAGAAD